MILGGLVSLGVKPERLIDELKNLDLSVFDVEFSTVDRSGISAVHAKTKYQEEKTHRHLSDIEKIISDSSLKESVKKRAIEVFTKLAEAEAKVHGVGIEKVHFHEVGAMDAILDVVGACIGFDILEVERFVCSKIHVGSGFISIAHGKYPVPPPAVAELIKGIPFYSTEIDGELITPTGAAIISTLCEQFGEIEDFASEKIGYGAGTREYQSFPNVLRLMLGDSAPKKSSNGRSEKLVLIETNLDDISSEILGFVMERAFEMGALDCWFTPIQMKKNRPGTMVSVLCSAEDKEKFAELLYNETTTLGVRIKEIERECLDRETLSVKTEFGKAEVKIALLKERIVNIKPEYEDVRKISIEKGKPFKEIYEAFVEEAERK